MANEDDKAGTAGKLTKTAQTSGTGPTSDEGATAKTSRTSGTGMASARPRATGGGSSESDLEKAKKDDLAAQKELDDSWEAEAKAKAERELRKAIAMADDALDDAKGKALDRRRTAERNRDAAITEINAIEKAPAGLEKRLKDAKDELAKAEKELSDKKNALDSATAAHRTAKDGHDTARTKVARLESEKTKADKAQMDHNAEEAKRQARADYARELSLADEDEKVAKAANATAKSAAEKAYSAAIVKIELERSARDETLKKAAQGAAE